MTLHPGNTPPVPVIDTPAWDRALYSVGDQPADDRASGLDLRAPRRRHAARRLRAIRRVLRSGHRVTLHVVVSTADAAGSQARRRATIVLVK